jgi:hypothetical protein
METMMDNEAKMPDVLDRDEVAVEVKELVDKVQPYLPPPMPDGGRQGVSGSSWRLEEIQELIINLCGDLTVLNRSVSVDDRYVSVTTDNSIGVRLTPEELMSIKRRELGEALTAFGAEVDVFRKEVAELVEATRLVDSTPVPWSELKGTILDQLNSIKAELPRVVIDQLDSIKPELTRTAADDALDGQPSALADDKFDPEVHLLSMEERLKEQTKREALDRLAEENRLRQVRETTQSRPTFFGRLVPRH